MSTNGLVAICEEVSVLADGEDHEYVNSIMVNGYQYAYFILDCDVQPYGSPGIAEATFSVQLCWDKRKRATDWFDTSIHDLLETVDGAATITVPAGWDLGEIPDNLEAIAAQKFIQAQAIQVSADIHAAAIGIANPAPWVKLVVNNTGTGPATLTARLAFVG